MYPTSFPMRIKKIIGKLHLWLGLTSGLLVFVVAITGCLYAFQEEIQNLSQAYRFVEPRDAVFLPPSQLQDIAAKQLPHKHLHAILYGGKHQAAQAIFYHYEPTYYYITYLNPYSGEVLKVKNMDADFFRIVLNGHFYLWLPPRIGQPIVACATLVFLFMVLSGLVLWWPQNWKVAPQRFSIKWGAKWRRKNYDLHNVLGFYSLVLALVFALTGLVWGFQWFAKGYYTAFGGEKSLLYEEPVSDKKQKEVRLATQTPAIDRVWKLMNEQHPEAKLIEVHIPETDSSTISANSNTREGRYWSTDYRYFDQYTLEEKSVEHLYGRLAEAKLADKVMRMNYDIHVGAVLGLPGKILAFFASLIIASLPITGFMIWWGRRNKEKKKGKEKASDSAISSKQLKLTARP